MHAVSLSWVRPSSISRPWRELASPFPTVWFLPLRLKHTSTFGAFALADKPPASSRPGILVLINDADWELEGEATYALQANDNILFVSTLHGG